MRSRQTIQCCHCEAEITHFGKEHVIELAAASMWEKIPCRPTYDPAWQCPVCIAAIETEKAERGEKVEVGGVPTGVQ